MNVFRRNYGVYAEAQFGDQYRGVFHAVENSGLPGRGRDSVKLAGLRAASQVVAREMRKKVPVRTGLLRSSIKARSSVRTVEAQVRVEKPHWILIEYGVKRGVAVTGRPYGPIRAQPFIEPSFIYTAEKQLEKAAIAMTKEFNRIKSL